LEIVDMASSQTNTAERVGVAEGVEPAAANEDPAPAPLSLKARMAAIRADAFGIGKDNIKMKSKAGVEFSIKGHTVEAVLSEMRPLFVKHGVDMWPYLVERTYSGNRCDVLVDYTFERTDESDETRTIRWAGAGTDDGDKGFSKAGTNCLKEMLKKTFLITDREDAKEEEDKVEHKPEGVSGAVEKANATAAKALQQWAVTFKAALESASTAKEIDRLKTDSMDQLNDPELPAVTRQFFFDLILKRKGELPK
jgi:hypothetical protein